MRKGSETIGKSIVTYDTGEKVAYVRDLIFDERNNKVLGFLVHEGRWFSDARVIPVSAVHSIGPDSMIVTSFDEVVTVEQVPEIQTILEEEDVLKNKKIMTTDGRDLGMIIDLYFDDQTWAVEGYEASGGMFVDVYSGRSFVPAPQTLKIGKKYAFVEPEVAEKMKEQVGGIEAAMQTAGEKMHAVTEAAGERIQSVSQTAAEKLQKTKEAAGQKLQETRQAADKTLKTTAEKTTETLQAVLPHRTVEQTKGRRVQQAVQTETGLFIAASGQIVTDEVIEKARQHHQEKALMDAVGLTTGEVVRSGAGDLLKKTGEQIKATTQAASERLREGAEHAQEGAQHLWGQIKERATDIQESTAEKIEQRRIQGTIGCRVNRAILDQEDNIILDAGELITHEAIERAREAGVLGTLLSSVGDKKSDSSEAKAHS